MSNRIRPKKNKPKDDDAEFRTVLKTFRKGGMAAICPVTNAGTFKVVLLKIRR